MGRGIVIGERKGKKCRVRYPSMIGGYITHTFSSIEDAKEHLEGVLPDQRHRAKITVL